MEWKICFVGLGSIGKRHLKNLRHLLSQREISAQIHAYRSSREPLDEDTAALLDEQIFSFDDLASDYDICFITNPTVLHYETIKKLLPKTKHLFVEKPLFSQPEENMEEILSYQKGILYVAAPLRYHPVFQEARRFVEKHSIYSAQAICSSYLPHWRAQADYRTCYSAQKQLGGGVMLDLIHEWDYLHTLFGSPEKLYLANGKFSALEIDSDDLAAYIAVYHDKIVELHLDYFGRSAKRTLRLYSRDCVFTADFIGGYVQEETENECHKILLPPRDMYLEEMGTFLDLCMGSNKNNPNSAEYAYQTLKLAWGETE